MSVCAENDALQSLFMIILSAGSQELTEIFVTPYESGITEELKSLSHFLRLPFMGTCCSITVSSFVLHWN